MSRETRVCACLCVCACVCVCVCVCLTVAILAQALGLILQASRFLSGHDAHGRDLRAPRPPPGRREGGVQVSHKSRHSSRLRDDAAVMLQAAWILLRKEPPPSASALVARLGGLAKREVPAVQVVEKYVVVEVPPAQQTVSAAADVPRVVEVETLNAVPRPLGEDKAAAAEALAGEAAAGWYTGGHCQRERHEAASVHAGEQQPHGPGHERRDTDGRVHSPRSSPQQGPEADRLEALADALFACRPARPPTTSRLSRREWRRQVEAAAGRHPRAAGRQVSTAGLLGFINAELDELTAVAKANETAARRLRRVRFQDETAADVFAATGGEGGGVGGRRAGVASDTVDVPIPLTLTPPCPRLTRPSTSSSRRPRSIGCRPSRRMSWMEWEAESGVGERALLASLWMYPSRSPLTPPCPRPARPSTSCLHHQAGAHDRLDADFPRH